MPVVFDLTERLWLIQMKASREHRIPLSDATLAILLRMKENHRSYHVFPGSRLDKPLSDMSLTAVFKRMGRGDLMLMVSDQPFVIEQMR